MDYESDMLEDTRPVTALETQPIRVTDESAPLAAPLRLLPLPRLLLLWLICAVSLTFGLPVFLTATLGVAGESLTSTTDWLTEKLTGGHARTIAPLFTDEVDYWARDLVRWSRQYHLDPNLLATVMQIESCGHDTVVSVAGASGLFQVMPQHFEDGENHTDPETNVKRGAAWLNTCLKAANSDPGLAMACYNGGGIVLRQPFTEWASETQRYYLWGLGIYTDAITHQARSQTLESWLAAGGSRLCDQAEAVQE